jgi:hypothetical protein
LTARLYTPADIASRVALRVMFGAIMLWEVYRYFDHDWIRRYYIEPDFFFKYYGFGWVRPWPGIGMYLHFLALGLLAIFITVGLWYRISIVLFFVGFTYVFLLDQANYLNHFYFVSLMSFLMIFVPAHRAASIDAWRRPALRAEVVAVWSLWLLRAQVAILYFYAGVAKINTDFLRGEPMRMWLADRSNMSFFGDHLPVGRLFTQEWVVYLFSYGGLLFDLLVAPALLWKRTRMIAFAFALAFHLMNVKLFSIGIFPWFSIAATLLFFSPDWPRRIFNWPRSTALLPPLQRGESRGGSRPRVVITFMAVYLAVQALVPLRHFLYPGNVSWTEEGHRFSWHMKLRDKEAGRVEFEARDPSTGQTWPIKPRDYLSKRQAEKMPQRPDMVLQFAHYMAAKLREKHGCDIEIRANIKASLNDRNAQLLIGPHVNLAAQERNLLPAAWILPLAEE